MWRWIILFIGLSAVVGCGLLPPDEAVTPPPSAEPTTRPVTPTETAAQTAVPPTAESSSPTTVPLVFAPAVDAYPRLMTEPILPIQVRTAGGLRRNLPPERDDVALAVAYSGVDPAAIATPPPDPEPLSVGTTAEFVVNNVDANTNSTVTAVLRGVGEHAYFWFDQTAGNADPAPEQVAEVALAFDDIYEQMVAIFGPEERPGVDGDLRVHVFNASPGSICNSAASCGLLGYFSGRDGLPREVNPQSNEREMFVMNGRVFGSPTYLEVLGHEFRHMIEFRYDRNDIDWEVEGSAMLAEDLLGYPQDGINRANSFLVTPDMQLNRWSESNTLARYGQGYLLNRYIYDRLGAEGYTQFAQHPAPGLTAVTAVAQGMDVGVTGEQLWVDWLAAAVVHDHPQAPDLYDLPEGVRTAASTEVGVYPFTAETTVNQYAADYYRLEGTPATLSFRGATHVPLLDVNATSGRQMWVANRANFSMARLTRRFDLSGVETATLQYNLYADIEAGYDFGYLWASADGETWRPLVTAGMSERSTADPSRSAPADHFYTGRGGEWVSETADLSAFAGGEVWIRFEYVTDPILTYEGLAVDDIVIPEIGFVDDAEADAGWTADGFVRASSYLPQEWVLQLVTFPTGTGPVVTALGLTEEQTANLSVPVGGERPPILIVAARALMTLQPAHYSLTVSE